MTDAASLHLAGSPRGTRPVPAATQGHGKHPAFAASGSALFSSFEALFSGQKYKTQSFPLRI